MKIENYFSTSWDYLVKGITIIVFVLLVSLLIIFSFFIDDPYILVSLSISYFLILFLPFLWSPQGYFVHNDIVTVKRLIGDKKIIVAMEPKRWNWTWWGLRLFGSGGLYGYFGFFTFKGTGRVQMYSTNRHNLVHIRDNQGKKYLLSPKEPDRFIQLLQKSIS